MWQTESNYISVSEVIRFVKKTVIVLEQSNILTQQVLLTRSFTSDASLLLIVRFSPETWTPLA